MHSISYVPNAVPYAAKLRIRPAVAACLQCAWSGHKFFADVSELLRMKTRVERSTGGVDGYGVAICTVSGHAVVDVGSGNVSWRVWKRKEGRKSVVWSMAERHKTPASLHNAHDLQYRT
jgi:hypothetical protein